MGSGPLLQLSEREWDRVLDVNPKGSWIVWCGVSAILHIR
jgi:hypothetical protein